MKNNKSLRNAEGQLFDLRLKLMIINSNPFINVIGGILMSLNIRADEKTPTAYINISRKEIVFGVNFINKLTDRQLRGLLMHEVMHYLFVHDLSLTTDKISFLIMNIAQDIKINHYLLTIGEELPENGIIPNIKKDNIVLPMFNNLTITNISSKTSEQIYKELMNQANKMSSKSLEELLENSNIDIIAIDEQESEDGDTIEKSISNIKNRNDIAQDAENIIKNILSKQAGKELLQKEIDMKLIPENVLKLLGWYRSFLHKMKNKLSNIAYKLYRYKTPYPKKREYAYDIFVNKKANRGYVVNIFCDTSGSMSEQDIQNVTKHITAICKYADIYFYCFDTEIYEPIKIKKQRDIEKIKIKGRGGTDINKVLKLSKIETTKHRVINILYSDLYDSIESKETNSVDMVIVTKSYDKDNAKLFRNVINIHE